MISRRKKYLAWVLYIPVLFSFLLYVIFNFSFDEVLSLEYGLFLLLAVVVGLSPVRTKDSVFSLVTGVSIAAFVILGLIPEIIISSIAFLYILFRSDVKWDQHHRYALNLLMIFFMSILSAGAYYWAADAMSGLTMNYYNILPLTIYTFVHILVNQFYIFILQKFYYKMEGATFFNDFLTLSFKISINALPFSLILIFLYNEMGVIGIVLGAIPFVTLSFGAKYFYQSKSRNTILMDLNKYSRKLNENESVRGVIEAFNKYLLKLIPSKNIMYFETMDGTEQVILKQIYNNDETIEEKNQEVQLKNQSLVSQALEEFEIKTFSKSNEWQVLFTKDVEFHIESGVVLPVHILNRNIGVVVICHSDQSVYDDFLLSLIEIFYKYFLIVLDNANNFERLEMSNVTDYLTKLPNLRGFRKEMKAIRDSDNYESVSVIVLDLDYFKQINDEHGHEAGNDVLRQTAAILKEFTKKDLYVARYGGEEFIMLLKDYDKKLAYELAEQIRIRIKNEVFKLHYSISAEKPEISVTASLGIATYPDDSEDLYELITLADRVMYLESKRNGRNRVAEFLRES